MPGGTGGGQWGEVFFQLEDKGKGFLRQKFLC